MNQKLYEELVNQAISYGADFCDLFFEKKKIKKYLLTDSRVDKITTEIEKGIGIRICEDNKIFSSSTNCLDKNNLVQKIEEIGKFLSGKEKIPTILLKEEFVEQKNSNIISHSQFPLEKKKQILYDIDNIARSYSKNVIQVEARLFEMDQEIEIANSTGKFITDTRMLTRLYINVFTKEEGKVANFYTTIGFSGGCELLDSIDLEKEVGRVVSIACQKLHALPCPSGEFPVVIGPGFGAVILHEACGHALEATSVAKKLSILSDKKGEKIANSKVTLIDDGTIENEWGSLRIDDEGNKTQKNVLIENGILKNYLVDYLNSKKMNCNITGSGRRESYRFDPTSRMNNTYLAPQTDKIEDMIQTIKLGVYAKSMAGGSVDPITGDFNFGTIEAYLIKNGKIDGIINDSSLIGNTTDILKKIEMVSDDLSIETGWCGSDSGNVAVTIGQPTIKVSSILVGGDKDD